MNNSDIPPMICVSVRYDKNLQEITKQEKHPVYMNQGGTFMFLLHCIFTDYPEIQEQYLPGMLGFTVNGVAPGLHCVLFDGDEIWFEGVV